MIIARQATSQVQAMREPQMVSYSKTKNIFYPGEMGSLMIEGIG